MDPPLIFIYIGDYIVKSIIAGFVKNVRLANAKNVLVARNELLAMYPEHSIVRERIMKNGTVRRVGQRGDWDLGLQVGNNHYYIVGLTSPAELKELRKRVVKGIFMRPMTCRFTATKPLSITNTDSKGVSVTRLNPNFA